MLVNGAEGIGTGWSTKVPNYDPRQLVANIRRMINDEDPKPMVSRSYTLHQWLVGPKPMVMVWLIGPLLMVGGVFVVVIYLSSGLLCRMCSCICM